MKNKFRLIPADINALRENMQKTFLATSKEVLGYKRTELKETDKAV